MLKNPRLKYCFHAEFLDEKNVLLTSEKENVLLSGELYNQVLSEIQHNGLPTEELAARLKGKASVFDIYFAVDALEEKGYITEAAPSMPKETCAYWNTQGIEVNTLLKVLEEKPVTIEAVGPLNTDAFLQAFGVIGIKIGAIKTGEPGALRVVITDSYERDELREINQRALETKRPWMLVKPNGVEIWVGPIFLPGDTGCWDCLRQRLGYNRQINTFYKAHQNTEENLHLPASHIPLSIQIAADQSAVEIAKWLYFGKNERLEGKIASFDTQSFQSQSHVLVKRPQCKTCGQPFTLEQKPMVLKKTSTYCTNYLGGYREVPPEDTLEKYGHHVSRITGVVQKLVPYHSIQDTPIYNYLSGRNVAFQSKSLFWLNSHLRNSTGGKGRTWSQAKTGALCEAIERYSCTSHGEEPYIVTSLKELGDKGIHPNTCQNFSQWQYDNREEINKYCPKFHFLISVPFDESLKMHWTSLYSLTHRDFKYLPSCFCFMQYPQEQDDWHLLAYPDSNGGSTGNILEEAILHGFLEVVERDCVALWWYNKIRRPAVDLVSFNEPYFLKLIEYYKSLNRSLYVLDITSDLQIPTFVAISHRLDDEKQDIVLGCGAHVDYRIAIERSLVEVNQILPLAMVSDEDRAQGKYRTQDKPILDWLMKATMENQPYLVPLDKRHEKKVSDYPQLCEPNVYDAVTFCVNAAAEQGLETLVLNMTRPDVKLPVVRVIVPHMRHFWKRLGPGRLYDVPVKMGWLDKPRKEEEMNPIGVFL